MIFQQAQFPIGDAQLASRILACLEDTPRHTLDLLAELEQTSRTLPEPGTLYRVLASLERQGWIEPLAPEHCLRPYALTPAGEDTLRQFRCSVSIHDERIDAGSHDHRRKETHMRLNRTLLRLYPHTWRERYEEEMLAVLEQHTITPTTIFDLLFGAIDARLDPHYWSQRSLLTMLTPRHMAIAFITLLAFLTSILFIWQLESVPYQHLVPTTVTLPGTTSTRIVYLSTFAWNEPGYVSNILAVVTAYSAIVLLLIAVLSFVVRIIGSAPTRGRASLALLAAGCLLLPLLALPFLQDMSLSSLSWFLIYNSGDHFQVVQSISRILQIPFLEMAGSGLFIGLVKGAQAIRERRLGLLGLVALVVLLPAMGLILVPQVLAGEEVDRLLNVGMAVFTNSQSYLLPFVGFGVLLLAVGTDELPQPFLRRCLRYASVIGITLLVSSLASIAWNMNTRMATLEALGSSSLTAQDFYLNTTGRWTADASFLIPWSILALVLIIGMGCILNLGYYAISSPPAQEKRPQPPEMMQVPQS